MSEWNLKDIDSINTQSSTQQSFNSRNPNDIGFVIQNKYNINEDNHKIKKRLDRLQWISDTFLYVLMYICVALTFGIPLGLGTTEIITDQNTLMLLVLPPFLGIFLILGVLHPLFEKITYSYYKSKIVKPILINRLGYMEKESRAIRKTRIWKKIARHISLNNYWNYLKFSDCFLGTFENASHESVCFAFADIGLYHSTGGKNSHTITDYKGQIIVLPLSENIKIPFGIQTVFSSNSIAKTNMPMLKKAEKQCNKIEEILLSNTHRRMRNSSIFTNTLQFSDEFNLAYNNIKTNAKSLHLLFCINHLMFIVQYNEKDPFEIGKDDRKLSFEDLQGRVNTECDQILSLIQPLIEAGIV